MAATGVESGRIYLWSVNTPQRWSALAPDFAEVEENHEYVELEDEFDIQPLEELHKRRLDLEDEDVDVLSIDPAKPGQSATQQFRMPVLLDIDASDSEDEMVAIGAGQYRRKSQGADTELLDEDEDTMDELPANGHDSDGGARRRRRR